MRLLNHIQNMRELHNFVRSISDQIRNNEIDIGRHHYALPLLHGVLQAIHCDYDKLVAVELGVAWGNGLFDLCKSAEFFRKQFEIDIQVYGFDNATGLPPITDYRDHPELWYPGDYKMPDAAEIISKLPDFAHLIIGDVQETIPELEESMYGYRLGFVAVDVDYYSSTLAAFKMLEFSPHYYVPAVPMYFDDIEGAITYNPWSGEEGAANDFNKTHELRKIQRRTNYPIHHFHVCHILDHPIRTGKLRPRFPLQIFPGTI